MSDVCVFTTLVQDNKLTGIGLTIICHILTSCGLVSDCGTQEISVVRTCSPMWIVSQENS